MKKIHFLALIGCISPSVMGSTLTWDPDPLSGASQVRASFDYGTGANWSTGTAPTSTDSVIFDASNAYSDGSSSNIGQYGEYFLTVNDTQTLGAGQTLITSGTAINDVNYLDLAVINSGTFNIYGSINMNNSILSQDGSSVAERFLYGAGSTYKFYSGSSVIASDIDGGGTLEYAVSSLSDTFSVEGVNAFRLTNMEGFRFDLTGLTDNLDGASFTIGTGNLTGTYDDAKTTVVGSSLYDATVIQSGTGAGQTLTVQFNAIPEPSSTALISLAGVSLLIRRRRN